MWPSLTAPTNFKGEGPLAYETKLKLSAKGEGVMAFLAQLEEAHGGGARTVNEQRERNGEKPLSPKQLQKMAPLPWQPELDDAGEETGNIVIKAKLKSERKMRGALVAQRPALFDGDGQPFDLDTPIWSGSKIRIAVEPAPYYVPALGYGLSLRLKAVQISAVVNGDNEDLSAEGYGFDVTETTDPVVVEDAGVRAPVAFQAASGDF